MFPPPCRRICATGVLGTQKHALQVCIDDEVPLLFAGIDNVCLLIWNAYVVDQDVQPNRTAIVTPRRRVRRSASSPDATAHPSPQELPHRPAFGIRLTVLPALPPPC